MRRIPFALAAVLIVVCGCGQELTEQMIVPTAKSSAVPFKVTFDVDLQDLVGQGQVYFLDQYAVEMQGDSPQAIYDLNRMSCREEASGDFFLYRQCEAWIEASTEKTEQSLAEISDEELIRFTENWIHPNLKTLITQDGTLMIMNELIVYEISSWQFPSGDQNRRFFKFSRLSACRNTMLAGRESLPVPWLAAVEILDERGTFPNEIKATVKLPQGDVVATSYFTIEEMTPPEQETIRALLNE